MASLPSKQKPPTAAVPPLICIGALCIGKRFALIRSQGTLRCQDSSPNQALASRSTDTTATNHIGECPRKQLLVFCQKSVCKSVQKRIVSLPNGGPPRDSQTGWFPRNLWPPKCQFRSWKFQFKLKLSHGVIVVETKNSNSSCSTFNLHWDCMYWKTFFAFEGTLRCQDSSPNQDLASRSTDITATNRVGNLHEHN